MSKLFNFPSHRCVCMQQAVTCLHPDSTGNKLSARNLGYLERSKEQERTRLNVVRKGPLPRAHSRLCVSPAHRLLQTRRLEQDLHKKSHWARCWTSRTARNPKHKAPSLYDIVPLLLPPCPYKHCFGLGLSFSI